MYIAARTEDDDVWFWTGTGWSDSPEDAEYYGDFAGSYEMGKLEVEYLASYGGSRYHGVRIESIYSIS